MNLAFAHSLHGEWLKQRRSLALWMVVIGAFFTPAIIVVARLLQHARLPALYASAGFWESLWRSSWESAAIFFLPMGAILATSLVTQIEFRNNAWKQVHALPLGTATIYFSKLAILVLMLALWFVLFNLGIYLSAVLPWLLVPGVPYPASPLPLGAFLREDLAYVIDCLPIVALQYLVSLRFANFLVPVGAGFMLWVGTLGAISWRWGFLSPYGYTILQYLQGEPVTRAAVPAIDIHVMAIAYFVLFTALGYLLFATRRRKG